LLDALNLLTLSCSLTIPFDPLCQSTIGSPTTSSSGKNELKSRMDDVYTLPSLAEKVQNSFIETPTASQSRLGTPFVGALARERALMQDTLNRQRLIEATMSTSASSTCLHGDATYMTAVANLRRREAILNLDRAIHEAEKRRYGSFPYANPILPRLASVLPGSASFPSNVPSIHHAYGASSSTRGLSIGTTSPLGSIFHERALLHSRLGGINDQLKGDIRDRVSLHPGVLPMRDFPISTNLTSRSRERLAEIEHLLKLRSPSKRVDRVDDSNPKSSR
jgi:hypothetical protein